MRNTITKIAFILLASIFVIGGTTSCKSKKRLAREAAEAEYNAKVSDAIRDLTAILNDETAWTLEEKEARVATIKSWDLNHAEVDDLLFQVDKKLARERAQAALKAEEERQAELERQKAQSAGATLEAKFDAIAGANSINHANSLIEQTLTMFSSREVPVLIIISQAGGFNDYDKPTTIERYLNYVKDQKQSRNKVANIIYDNNNKIKELELIKK